MTAKMQLTKRSKASQVPRAIWVSLPKTTITIRKINGTMVFALGSLYTTALYAEDLFTIDGVDGIEIFRKSGLTGYLWGYRSEFGTGNIRMQFRDTAGEAMRRIIRKMPGGKWTNLVKVPARAFRPGDTLQLLGSARIIRRSIERGWCSRHNLELFHEGRKLNLPYILYDRP